MRGFEDWTLADVKKHNERIAKISSNDHLLDIGKMVQVKNKKSKYGAKKVEIDGVKFDSQKEADYYNELKLRLSAGDIKGFCRQAEFVLAPNLRYKADFVVFNSDGTADVIDVKGFKTDVYKLKKKLFEDKFKLKIKEI